MVLTILSPLNVSATPSTSSQQNENEGLFNWHAFDFDTSHKHLPSTSRGLSQRAALNGGKQNCMLEFRPIARSSSRFDSKV